MVFRAQGAKTFKVRIDHPDGRHAVLTTGCVLETDAATVEQLVHRWQGRQGKKLERLDVIDALVSRRVKLPAAVDAFNDNTLDALVAEQPAIAAAPPLDLLAGDEDHPSVIDRWVRSKKRSKKGAGQAEIYKKQVLVLFPERPFAITLFTRRELWARLEKLEVDAPTRNRYRTAASSLAKFLVADELLESNFVRDVEGYGENDPRLVYYELTDEVNDPRTLIAALPQPNAALAAMALGFCMEWGALTDAIVGDIQAKADPIVAKVRGTKTGWRDRDVPLVPELAWVMEFIRPALEGKLPGARIFEGLHEWTAIDTQRDVARGLGVHAVGEAEFGEHSLHDWRQTHTVALLRWGYGEQIAAAHNGHGNTTMVRRKYGRFVPTRHDYAKGSGATKSITSKNRRRGGKR